MLVKMVMVVNSDGGEGDDVSVNSKVGEGGDGSVNSDVSEGGDGSITKTITLKKGHNHYLPFAIAHHNTSQ